MGIPASLRSCFDFFLVQGDGLMAAGLNFMNSLRKKATMWTHMRLNFHSPTVGQTGESFYFQFRDKAKAQVLWQIFLLEKIFIKLEFISIHTNTCFSPFLSKLNHLKISR